MPILLFPHFKGKATALDGKLDNFRLISVSYQKHRTVEGVFLMTRYHSFFSDFQCGAGVLIGHSVSSPKTGFLKIVSHREVYRLVPIAEFFDQPSRRNTS